MQWTEACQGVLPWDQMTMEGLSVNVTLGPTDIRGKGKCMHLVCNMRLECLASLCFDYCSCCGYG